MPFQQEEIVYVFLFGMACGRLYVSSLGSYITQLLGGHLRLRLISSDDLIVSAIVYRLRFFLFV